MLSLFLISYSLAPKIEICQKYFLQKIPKTAIVIWYFNIACLTSWLFSVETSELTNMDGWILIILYPNRTSLQFKPSIYIDYPW